MGSPAGAGFLAGWWPGPPPWWLPLLAYALDLALGDPRWLTHPVVIIGHAVSRLERLLRRPWPPAAQQAAGALLVAVVVAGAYLATAGLVRAAAALHPVLGAAVQAWLLSACLAARGLGDAGRAVAAPLGAGDLAGARQAVGAIVGRDTDRLDADGVARAAIESVAENASDGVIGPLLFGLLGGAPLAMAYKAASTMDSMLGYRNERYLYFGRAAARLDDLLNLLPARLTALLFLAAGRALGHDPAAGWRSMRRGARLHASPNSGYPEAAMAGLLRVQLGGISYFQGRPKGWGPVGEPVRPLDHGRIRAAVAVMHLAGVLALALGCAALAIWR